MSNYPDGFFHSQPQLLELESRCTPAFVWAFVASTHTLNVTGSAAAEQCVITRGAGGAILLNGSPTGATTTTADRILIDSGASQDAITIDFSHGLLGPGFTSEANGVGEIEIDLVGPGSDSLTLYGTLIDDVFDMGMTNGVPAINLNGDNDIDITAPGATEFRIHGGRGNDTLNAAGSTVVGTPLTWGVGLWGDGGNDKTIGGEGLFNSHFAGAGNDTMIGGKTLDRYFFAGGGLGSDSIQDYPDHNNDAIIFSNSVAGDFIGPANLNLSLTTTQIVNAGNLTLTLKVKDGVDHIIGSNFADHLVANSLGSILTGNGGDDELIGQGGVDELRGGTGDDCRQRLSLWTRRGRYPRRRYR
jgi:hypothetical protein